MGKTLDIPSNTDASTVKSNSDIGTLTVIDSQTLEGENVDTTIIRNTLGEDNNNVGLLCTSNKINKWSLFKPGDVKVDTTNNVFTLEAPSAYRMGDFLAYDHQATVPGPTQSEDTYEFDDDDNSVSYNLPLNLGLIRWSEVSNITIDRITAYVYYGGSLQQTKEKLIDDAMGGTYITLDLTIQTYSDYQYDIEIWFGNSTTAQHAESPNNFNYTLYMDYKTFTTYEGIQLDITAMQAGYYASSQSEDIAASSDQFWLDVKIFDSGGSQVSDTVEVQVSVNGGAWYTAHDVNANDLTSVSISDTDWTYIEGYFPQGIDKYGDTWQVKLVTNLG